MGKKMQFFDVQVLGKQTEEQTGQNYRIFMIYKLQLKDYGGKNAEFNWNSQCNTKWIHTIFRNLKLTKFDSTNFAKDKSISNNVHWIVMLP